MIHALLISGLGQPAQNPTNGMAELAARLGEESGLIAVTMWSHSQQAQATRHAAMTAARDAVVLVGHSFGGDCAVAVARDIPRSCGVFAVDPVPRSVWQRLGASAIYVPRNVTRAICVRRGRGVYPFAKRLEREPGGHADAGRVENITMSNTTHNGVMQSVRTHQMIVDFILDFL
jgi:pimeloyl-ACP methyl ester carboxylesterase